MGSNCAATGCPNTATYGGDEVESRLGMNLNLCDSCFERAYNKLKARRNSSDRGGYRGSRSAGLNISSLISNALLGLATPDRAKHLQTLMFIATNKDYSAQITAISANAKKSDIDLMPPGRFTADTLNHEWWQNLFKTFNITSQDNQAYIVRFVKERIANLSEGKFGDFIAGAADKARKAITTAAQYAQPGPSGALGKAKNNTVAKVALDAISNLFDKKINGALQTVGLNLDDLPEMIKIFQAAIIPVIKKTNNFTTNDANAIANGDPKYYRDILKAYKAYQAITKSIKNIAL
jgi:hypothetical protein